MQSDSIGRGNMKAQSHGQVRRGVSSMVEQRTFNPWVQGSSPWRPTCENLSRSAAAPSAAAGTRSARGSVLEPWTGAAGMSEGQMWDLVGLRPQVVWHPEWRRNARRGAARLLVLVVLASAGAGFGLAGDGMVSVGSCAQFVTTVRTNEPGYAPGQMVIISVSEANDGPVCTIPPQPCGPPSAFVSAHDVAGRDVWDPGARKTIRGMAVGDCLPEPGPSMTWPAHYSDTQIFDWGQDKCALGPGLAGHVNPDCPGTQVPAGTYRIVGVFYWSDGRTVGQGPSASATITIFSRIPVQGPQHRSPGDARA